MQKKWIDIQKKTLQAWVNHTLSTRAMVIHDLSTDFADGVVLINLLEILSGKTVGRYSLKPSSRFLKIENVVIALKFIDQKLQLKLYGTSAEDIVDGNTKIILGMVWRLIQTFRIGVGGDDGLDDAEETTPVPVPSTSSSRSQIHSAGPSQSALKRKMLSWCQRQLEGYPSITVDNFDTSFANGVAFCALVHRMNPHIIDLNTIEKESAAHNLTLAFRLAEEHLGIPQLLDPKDMIDGKPDELSVMTYISEFLYAFRDIEKARKADAQKTLDEEREKDRERKEREDKERDLQREQERAMLEEKEREMKMERERIREAERSRKEKDTQADEQKVEAERQATKELGLAKATEVKELGILVPRVPTSPLSKGTTVSPTSPEHSPFSSLEKISPERTPPMKKNSLHMIEQRGGKLNEMETLKQQLHEQQEECALLRIKLAKKRKKLNEYRIREQEWRDKVESLLRENEELREGGNRQGIRPNCAADDSIKTQGLQLMKPQHHAGMIEAMSDFGATRSTSGSLEHVSGLKMPAPAIPHELFQFLTEEIYLTKILMEQVEAADTYIAWDHEADNHWREDSKLSQDCAAVESLSPEAHWDERSLIRVQRQVRVWLARRIVAKQKLVKRCKEEENKMIRLQARIRGWLARKRYRELLYMLAQRTESAKELQRSERKYVESLRVIIEVFLNPLRKPNSPLNPAQVKSIFSDIEVIMNYTAILLDRVEQKIATWSHETCLGEIFLKLTDFLKVYTQYVYNFPKALTTINACKQKGPFKAFLQDCLSNPRCGDLDLITYLNMPVLRIHYYVAIFEDLLAYTPEYHPDSDNIKLAVQKVRDVVKYVEEKRKLAENMKEVLRVQDSLVGKSAEIENLAQPSRRFIREGPLTVIRGTNDKKESYCFLFNDLLVIGRKQKVKVPKGKGKPTYKFVLAVPISPRTVVKLCPETVYTTPHSFQLINTMKQYTFACSTAKQQQIWFSDVSEAINMMVMQQKTIAEKLAETGNKLH